MTKQFLVIDLWNDSTYIVENLESLINEMYECDLENHSLEQVTGWFYNNHRVFEINGDVKEINHERF